MNIRIITIALLLATLPVSAQKKKTVVNDSNTPLHLLQPAYQGTYGDLTPGQVKKDIDRSSKIVHRPVRRWDGFLPHKRFCGQKQALFHGWIQKHNW